jgi:ribosomal protein S18 acetylase RimI-like enzyme
LEDSSGELTAYSGPDAVSFESVGVLAHLLAQAQPAWRVRGALRHSVWTSLEDYRAWTGLGYEPVSVSLAREWMPHTRVTSPHDVSVRPALTSDLPVLRELDHEIDRAQGERIDDGAEERLRELLEDPEVSYLVATFRDEVVAQVVTWDLGDLVGYPRHTLHVSDLAVRREARRLGVATYLISESVRRHPHPVRLVEARSRVSNAGAVAFWNRLGCRTLFVQVERALD